MTVIAFLNKKGGSGKSTAVIGLGLYWAIREGKKVGVLDMEVEGLAASVIDLVDHPNLSLWEPGGAYDYMLIDTEGGIASDELADVTAHADHLIIPMKPSPADVAKVMQTLDLLHSNGQALPKNTRLLFSQVRVIENAWKERGAYTRDIPVKPLKAYIRLRSVYPKMLVRGWKALSRPAVEELETLAAELR